MPKRAPSPVESVAIDRLFFSRTNLLPHEQAVRYVAAALRRIDRRVLVQGGAR